MHMTQHPLFTPGDQLVTNQPLETQPASVDAETQRASHQVEHAFVSPRCWDRDPRRKQAKTNEQQTCFEASVVVAVVAVVVAAAASAAAAAPSVLKPMLFLSKIKNPVQYPLNCTSERIVCVRCET